MKQLLSSLLFICMVCGCKDKVAPTIKPALFDTMYTISGKGAILDSLSPSRTVVINVSNGTFSTNWSDRIARFLRKYPMTHQKKKAAKYQSGYPAYLEWDRISDKLDTLTQAQYDSLFQYHIKAGDSGSKMIFPEDSILKRDTIYKDTIITPPHGGMAYPDPMQPLPRDTTKPTANKNFGVITWGDGLSNNPNPNNPIITLSNEIENRIKRLEKKVDSLQHELYLAGEINRFNVRMDNQMNSVFRKRIDSLERRPVIYIDNLQKELWVKCPDGSCDVFIRKL